MSAEVELHQVAITLSLPMRLLTAQFVIHQYKYIALMKRSVGWKMLIHVH